MDEDQEYIAKITDIHATKNPFVKLFKICKLDRRMRMALIVYIIQIITNISTLFLEPFVAVFQAIMTCLNGILIYKGLKWFNVNIEKKLLEHSKDSNSQLDDESITGEGVRKEIFMTLLEGKSLEELGELLQEKIVPDPNAVLDTAENKVVMPGETDAIQIIAPESPIVMDTREVIRTREHPRQGK